MIEKEETNGQNMNLTLIICLCVCPIMKILRDFSDTCFLF